MLVATLMLTVIFAMVVLVMVTTLWTIVGNDEGVAAEGSQVVVDQLGCACVCPRAYLQRIAAGCSAFIKSCVFKMAPSRGRRR